MIQTTKTGVAIRPVSAEAQEKQITRMGEIENSLSSQGQCKVENPVQHVAYRLPGVPRTFTAFNGSTVGNKHIIAAVVAEALSDLTNVPPIKVLESRESDYSKFSSKKN